MNIINNFSEHIFFQYKNQAKMNLVYIILAAGLGERFKSKKNNIEKQFYLINKKSILEICIENFLKSKLNNAAGFSKNVL